MIKQKGFTMIIALFTIVVITGLVGAFYLGTKMNKGDSSLRPAISPGQPSFSTEQPTNTVSRQLPPTVIPTADPTADWKTYKNTSYGFEFKYPTEWYIFDYEENPGAQSWGFSTRPITSETKPVENLSKIVIFLTRISLENFLNNQLLNGEKNEGWLVMNGRNAVRLSYEGIDGSKNVRVAIDMRNNTLVFSGPFEGNEKNIFDQILSTFKFTK